MKAMRFHPPGFGGERRSVEEVKRDGWHEQGVLAVSVDDERLTWPEQELVRQLGDKLYGKREDPAMAEWTRDLVEERIIEAAAVLRRLPGPRSQGYFGTWPEIQRTAKEIAEGMPRPMRLPPPSTAAITRMEEAITWNRFLEPRRRPPDVGAGRGRAVEGALLPVRDQPADGSPALGVRAQRHRLAAERALDQPEAQPGVLVDANGVRRWTRVKPNRCRGANFH